MQRCGVDAGADDRRVGRTFATLLVPDGGHLSGDCPFGHAGLHGSHHLSLRGNRSLRGLFQQFSFGRILHFAQGHGERGDIVRRGQG